MELIGFYNVRLGYILNVQSINICKQVRLTLVTLLNTWLKAMNFTLCVLTLILFNRVTLYRTEHAHIYLTERHITLY